eukprot:SAG22_NODE_4274_length_1320_cov_1.796069_2_plen_38_part_01
MVLAAEHALYLHIKAGASLSHVWRLLLQNDAACTHAS